jgi:hypothetical protein
MDDKEFDEHYDYMWDELDEYEEAMDDCAWDCAWDGVAGHICMGIGSEDCDWECPFSNQMWRGLRQCRNNKGRFTKRENQEANGG